MDNKKLLVVIESFVEDYFRAHSKVIEGPQGPRGLRGNDGQSFVFEDHREEIREIISKQLPDKSELVGEKGRDGKDGRNFNFEESKEEIIEVISSLIPDKSELKGEKGDDGIDGRNGRDGRDGVDGRDFDFEESRSAIEEIISKAIPSADTLKGEKGDKGDKGDRGLDFSLEENLESITGIISNCIQQISETLKLKYSDLTEEEKLSLKGEKGEEGPQGPRGLPGKDFVLEEHKEYFETLRPDKLKFSDFTEEERLSIKGEKGEKGEEGPQGPRGLPGKDFVLEEHKEYFETLRPDKLKFSDFTEEEKESLRGEKGPQGPRGLPGKDFVLEEHKEYFETLRPDKLKFSDFTENEKESIRGEQGPQGPRGQRGKTGEQGEKGDRGERGPQGLQGAKGDQGVPGIKGERGIQGPRGEKGDPGLDAPVVDDIKVKSDGKDFRIVFNFSNGETIETNKVKLPTKSNVVSLPSYPSAGGGGSFPSGGFTEYFKEGTSIGKTDRLNFIGNVTVSTNINGMIDVTIGGSSGTGEVKVYHNGTEIGTSSEIDFVGDQFVITEVAGKIQVELDIPDPETEGFLEVMDEADVISTKVKKINFIGPYVTVKPRVPMSDWAALSDVEPSLEDYGQGEDRDAVDVYIEPPDPSILKNVNCQANVFVGAAVRTTAAKLAILAIADSYDNAQVTGIVISKTGNKCDIKLPGGLVEGLYSGLDPSKDYYLSDVDPGKFTTAVPTTPGHVELYMGQSFGTDDFIFTKGLRTVKS